MEMLSVALKLKEQKKFRALKRLQKKRRKVMLAYQHYQSQIQLTGMALLHVVLMYYHMFAIDKSVWCISR